MSDILGLRLDAGLVKDLAALLDLGDPTSGAREARSSGYLLSGREREACAALIESYRLKIINVVTGKAEEYGLEALANLVRARGET